VLYLLDANVLITAKNTYYAIARVPEYWDWLIYMGETNHVKIIQEVYEEVKDGGDELSTWAKQDEVKSALLFDETVDIARVRQVASDGYAPDLTDDELEKIGRDAFLIAYAMADLGNRTIVTTEVSKPRRLRANRHIPDVCTDFDVPCCDSFELTAALDFTTGWKK